MFAYGGPKRLILNILPFENARNCNPFPGLRDFANWPEWRLDQLWPSLNGHVHVHILTLRIFLNICALQITYLFQRMSNEVFFSEYHHQKNPIFFTFTACQLLTEF